MDEQKVFQQIKHYVCVILISFGLGYVGYQLTTQGVQWATTTADEVSTIRKINTVETRKESNWQTGNRMILKIKSDWRQHWSPESESGYSIKPTITKQITNILFWTWDIRQKYVNYAYKLWGMDLVLLMQCESATRTIDRVGDQWHALWLCQMNNRYHKLPKDYKTSRQVQVEYCAEKLKNKTPFYGPTRRIQWKPCYIYTQKYFIFN